MVLIIIGSLSYAIPTLILFDWDQPTESGDVQQGRSADFVSRGRGSSFDLSFSLIDTKEILSGGPAKDGIPALTEPKFVPASDADYLQPDAEIVGVKIGDDVRAYPINVLNWHEIINDTVGQAPIAVTYCPLCRSALVFDRKVGDRVLEFGVSGMLFNSNVLMYDRQGSDVKESLWSQIMMKAVTGPAAEKGETLTLRSSELTTWSQWQKEHPKTVVVSEETGHRRNYRQRAYVGYFQTDRLMFPVTSHGENPQGFRNKEPMIVVQSDQQLKAYAIRDIDPASPEKAYLEDSIADSTLCLQRMAEGNTVKVIDMKAKERKVPVAYMFWFSLNAILPDVEIYQPQGLDPKS